MSARVLIIEDELLDVKLLAEKLNNEYYTVVIAENGKVALDTIAEDMLPDIILMGVVTSVVEGMETCRRLKADPVLSYIPVIMVTTLNDQATRVQGLKAGADDFLALPINDAALFARIRSLVRLKLLTDELHLRDQAEGRLGLVYENPLIVPSDASILILDDNTEQADCLARHLQPFGHQLTVMKEPDGFLKEAMAVERDVIIVSALLRTADGLRLCSQLKSQEKLRHIPVLVIVEDNATSILVKAFDLGINDYLVLPLDGNEAVARVSTQIRRKRYQDALKKNYKRNVSMAVTDALTGLYNRHYFDLYYTALFKKSMTLAKPFSLLMVDVDHFKSVNDTYGHLAGDAVLRQICERLLTLVRPVDLVARYGGEEFVILLPETDLSLAARMAEHIRLEIERSELRIPGEQALLERTVSIGVASLQPGDTQEALIRRADRGLYIAKGQGRNRVEIM